MLYRSDTGEGVAKHFIDALLNEAQEIKNIMRKIVPMHLTDEQEENFKNSEKCYLCGGDFTEDNYSVRDHDHLTGEFRGAAHTKCNLAYSWKNYKIPVIFHNLKGYDSHFIIKAFNQEVKKIKLIPANKEKFVYFGFDDLEFIDSFAFIQTSLEKLTASLSGNNLEKINSIRKTKGLEKIDSLTKISPSEKNNILEKINKHFKHFNIHFKNLTDNEKILLTQKGIYPYDFMDSFEKFNHDSFPSIQECHNKLNDEDLSECDYERALTVWETFNIHNLGEYHDLYLKTDVLL